jgi:hypothetical protein
MAASTSGQVMDSIASDIRYSIVVPIYNEEAVLPILLRRLDNS